MTDVDSHRGETSSPAQQDDYSRLLAVPPERPSNFDRVVLAIDKPQGWSSFDVIRKLRRVLSVRKIGHAGTLDPMATGLLICLVGRATKLMTHFMELPKEYVGTLRLGEVTPSYDAETEVEERVNVPDFSMDDLIAATAPFLGDITQLPPMYSAVKVDGERLYKKARRGETVERRPRQVVVDTFELTDRRGNDVDFLVRCSKGTYIRSLAHDFGAHLGVGAHLTRLRRTRIGDYAVDNAWTMTDLEQVMAEEAA